MSKFYTFCDLFGGSIIHRYVDESGSKRVERITNFPFKLYKVDRFGEHTGFGGVPLSEQSIDSVEALNALKKFHSNEKLWGQTNPCLQFLSEEYPGEIKFNPSKITVAYIDIETWVGNEFPHPAQALQPVTAITMKFSDRADSVTLGCGSLEHPIENNRYVHCRDEFELLQKFLVEWRSAGINIVSGWNCEAFDLPYLINRMKKVLGETSPNALSPFTKFFKNGLIREKKLKGEDVGYDILGVVTYDYLNLYKKFNMGTPESYSLNHISSIELGERKIDYSDEGSLNDLYTQNFQKYVEYNVKDTLLVEKLEKKLRFINIALTMVYMTKSRLSDVHSPIRLWDTFLYNKLRDANIQIPPNEAHSEVQIVGGFVKEPLKGLHKWVVSFDLASLYPSIIIQHNLSPETIVKEATGNYIHEFIDKMCVGASPQAHETTILANGAEFRKDIRGLLPKVSAEMFELRKKYKTAMLKKKQEMEETSDYKRIEELNSEVSALDAMQDAIKKLMNSLYGSTANSAFRYFNASIAEGITMTGQMIIQYAERRLNEYLSDKFKTVRDRVIAIDTDSVFVELVEFYEHIVGNRVIEDKHKIVDVFDTFCKNEIEPKLAQWFSELSNFMNVYEPRLHMKREKIIDAGLWRAKKNYIIQVWDNEGVRYNQAKMMAVGVEIARSSTPGVVKDALKNAIALILNGTEGEVISFVKKFEQEFMELPLDVVSFPRGVSELDKWRDSVEVWKKGTPIHVKGSLVFNNLIHKNHIPMKEITSGDKIKFIYLKTPNPVQCNVISYHTHLPPEFGLSNYIDRKTQFEKTFLHPLKSFTDIIGWKTSEEYSVSDFFGEVDDTPKKLQNRGLTFTDDPVIIQHRDKRSESSESNRPRKVKKPITIDGFF